MRRAWWVGGLVAILVGVGATWAVASASSDISSPTTLRFFDKNVQVGLVGTQRCCHLGQQIVFGDALKQNGKRVGRLGGSFETVFVKPVRYQMVASATLPGGKITLQGLVKNSSTEPGNSYTMAVTGGTGNYANARGTVKFKVISRNSRMVARLIP